jgi:uncharacterized protein (UPF0303 family)
MDIATDLERIAAQEARLSFTRFDAASAWQLGNRLRELAEARGAAVVVEIRIAGRMTFFTAMPGTTPANADWARRKCNTVELTHRSSYAVGRAPLTDGKTFDQRMGLPVRDYAAAGGGFPITVAGVGIIGAVGVSGLPQRDDHGLIVEALAEMCGVPHAEVRLPDLPS